MDKALENGEYLLKKNFNKTARVKAAFNPYDPAFNPVQDAITLCIVVLTCLVQCLILNAFYTPYHMLSGGITGIAILLDYTASIPRWVTLVLLNIPVLIIGAKRVNVKFIVFSAVGTICYSVMFSLPFVRDFTIDLGENSELLSVIVGAALIGASGVPVVKRGATLGGMDILNVILSRRLSVPMGNICICYNIVIMAALGVFFGLKPALLSLMATFVSSAVLNYTMAGFNHTVTVFIISQKWDEIAPHVLNEMKRGVTFLNGEGAYTGEPRKIVYCIVRTTEIAALKAIVKANDPKALFSVIETKEVVGRGFGIMN